MHKYLQSKYYYFKVKLNKIVKNKFRVQLWTFKYVS